jgi:peptidoglycan L-alanyl-D-glutamate endopeptidase CwlK
MTFKFSTRSLNNLEGVKPELQRIAHRAIELTKIDFGVTCGLRTVEEQRELVARGASQTMKSKHITGDAIDVVAYIGPRISWELNLYDDIADAFKQAAIEEGVSIRWGAAWTVPDIRAWEGTMEDAMNSYIDTRRAQGRRPFIDSPHFELN